MDILKQKKSVGAYYASVAYMDDMTGQVLKALKDNGLEDNTIVIFTSDHGEALGDHGLMFKGCRFYEGLIRVPLIFAWPGQIESGLVNDELVELLDLTINGAPPAAVGSNAALIRRCRSITVGSITRGRKANRLEPTPCSPLAVPPIVRARWTMRAASS